MATSLSEATSLDAEGRIIGSKLADAVTSTVGAQSVAERAFVKTPESPVLKSAKIRRRRKK